MTDRRILYLNYKITQIFSILIHMLLVNNVRLSEKCLSFTDTSFITTHLYTNVKPNLSNVVIFILIEQNGS